MWELDYEESWAPKNWCFWTVVLEKTLESPLDCKEIQPIYPKGNQFWIFIGRTDAETETLILWPPHVKNWLIGKDPDAGQDWRWEEKGTTEDETVGWHHRLNGHELVMDREACHAAVHRVTKSQTQLNDWTEKVALVWINNKNNKQKIRQIKSSKGLDECLCSYGRGQVSPPRLFLRRSRSLGRTS